VNREQQGNIGHDFTIKNYVDNRVLLFRKDCLWSANTMPESKQSTVITTAVTDVRTPLERKLLNALQTH
jgi:hypothetical protein